MIVTDEASTDIISLIRYADVAMRRCHPRQLLRLYINREDLDFTSVHDVEATQVGVTKQKKWPLWWFLGKVFGGSFMV